MSIMDEIFEDVPDEKKKGMVRKGLCIEKNTRLYHVLVSMQNIINEYKDDPRSYCKVIQFDKTARCFTAINGKAASIYILDEYEYQEYYLDMLDDMGYYTFDTKKSELVQTTFKENYPAVWRVFYNIHDKEVRNELMAMDMPEYTQKDMTTRRNFAATDLLLSIGIRFDIKFMKYLDNLYTDMVVYTTPKKPLMFMTSDEKTRLVIMPMEQHKDEDKKPMPLEEYLKKRDS